MTELETLKNKCLLFNQFLIDKGSIPEELIDSYKESNKLIETAYKEKKIKPLRAMSRDIDQQVLVDMPLSMALELRSFFKEKLDIDFEIVEKARLKTIQRVIKKGKISTPIEYELLLNRVEEIYSDNTKKEEINYLNELLAASHK